ncbi:MAG TPA: hypothetical protein VGH28_04245 [Polyangiaceae bacterium]|jgi:hypothetical protein
MASNLAKTSRARANELLAFVERRKREITRAFYELGVALRELHEKKLWAALGYASFDAMLSEREAMSGFQARKLIEVVTTFDRDVAARLGAEKAYALARYVDRTKQDDDPAEYLLEGFPVGGRRKGIDEVTVRDILRETQFVVARQKGGHGENERARRDAESVARHVRAKLGERTEHAAEVALVFKRGAWRLRVELPVEMADRALRV